MKEKFSKICISAILVEALITYTNQFFYTGFSWEMMCSILLGILVAISYKIDIPEQLGLKSKIPFLGNVFTGILISRGSNYLFDLLNLFFNYSN